MTAETKWSTFLLDKVRNLQKAKHIDINTNIENHKNVEFKCHKCDQVFTQKANMKRHISYTHDYENANFYICDECNVKYTSKGMLKKHNLAKHNGVKLQCQSCQYETFSTENLKGHMNAQHKGTFFACDECEYRIGYKHNLKRHKNIMHGGLRFVCKLCNDKFRSSNGLIDYVKSKHDKVR